MPASTNELNHDVRGRDDHQAYSRIKQLQSKVGVFDNKVVGGVASFGRREKILKVMIDSILPQLDKLIVYLNNYKEIPEYLDSPKIAVIQSQVFEDLSANGKVFCLDNLNSCYFFALDDDIEYPSDYVERMIKCLQKYNNMVCVAVHGSIFPEKVQWYFERYTVYPFQDELNSDRFVNLIGSGTFAFHTDTLTARFSDFYGPIMVDLRFSILAKEQKIPLVCVARREYWLKALEPDDGLYQQYLTNKTVHTSKSIEHNPWGYNVYMPMIKNVVEKCFHKIDDKTIADFALDREFICSLLTNEPPDNWRETEFYRNRVSDREAVYDPIGCKNRLKWQIEWLENSYSYRFGYLVLQAIRHPGVNTLKLPYDLFKLFYRNS